jgi:hypothetical protein
VESAEKNNSDSDNENKDKDANTTNEVDKKEEDGKEEKEKDVSKAKKPIDLTICLVDSAGQKLTFPLSTFSLLQREIEVMIRKTDFIKGDKSSEKVFQTFYFPLGELQEMNPNFQISDIKELRFIFNKKKSGVIVIDNIGFMKVL